MADAGMDDVEPNAPAPQGARALAQGLLLEAIDCLHQAAIALDDDDDDASVATLRAQLGALEQVASALRDPAG